MSRSGSNTSHSVRTKRGKEPVWLSTVGLLRRLRKVHFLSHLLVTISCAADSTLKVPIKMSLLVPGPSSAASPVFMHEMPPQLDAQLDHTALQDTPTTAGAGRHLWRSPSPGAATQGCVQVGLTPSPSSCSRALPPSTERIYFSFRWNLLSYNLWPLLLVLPWAPLKRGWHHPLTHPGNIHRDWWDPFSVFPSPD